MKPYSRRKLILGQLSLLVIGTLVPLVIGEIGLRLFWSGYYLKDTAGRFQKDDLLGWIPAHACEELMAVLRRPKTTDWLDRHIRCRHLTVDSIRNLPWC